MATAPRVSVVVPAFENAPYIRAAVASVLAQTYADFELVVADHSSSDGTWEILQEFAADPRVRLLRTPAGGGAVAQLEPGDRGGARRAGQAGLRRRPAGSRCAGEQVAAFDAATVTGWSMVASARDIVDASGRVVIRGHGLGGLSGRVPGRRGDPSLGRCVGPTSSASRAACCCAGRPCEAVGGWHGDPGYLIDQSTYCRVLLHGDLATAPGALAAFRISSTQWSVRPGPRAGSLGRRDAPPGRRAGPGFA